VLRFTATHYALMLLCASLLLVFHRCSCFTTLAILLLCGASLFLRASLLSYPSRFLYAPCYFVVLLCFDVT
jgi:hypothetical protein